MPGRLNNRPPHTVHQNGVICWSNPAALHLGHGLALLFSLQYPVMLTRHFVACDTCHKKRSKDHTPCAPEVVSTCETTTSSRDLVLTIQIMEYTLVLLYEGKKIHFSGFSNSLTPESGDKRL